MSFDGASGIRAGAIDYFLHPFDALHKSGYNRFAAIGSIILLGVTLGAVHGFVKLIHAVI